LCDARSDDWRFICETEHSFCVICKWPLKIGHVLVLPKKCISQLEISKLTSYEVYDLNCLVQKMENSLNKLNFGDVITFKNSGKHSTETHFHFHLLPSKGALRDLFSNFENIPKRELMLKEDELKMRNLICEKLID
jgi:diadenosine tetraphosphate (Ap4A) HIT family hydrolase